MFEPSYLKTQDLLVPHSMGPANNLSPEDRALALSTEQRDQGLSSLDQLVLPSIVGVEHSDENLGETKRIVYGLPKNSAVGLEISVSSAHRGHPAFSRMFFSKLATYAESLGHRIRWLEPDAVTVGSLISKHWQRQLDYYNTPFFKKPARLLASINDDEFKRQEALHQEITETVAFRSVVMGRVMTRFKDWRESDVAIMGFKHAIHLADLLSQPLSVPKFSALTPASQQRIEGARDQLRKYFKSRQAPSLDRR